MENPFTFAGGAALFFYSSLLVLFFRPFFYALLRGKAMQLKGWFSIFALIALPFLVAFGYWLLFQM